MDTYIIINISDTLAQLFYLVKNKNIPLSLQLVPTTSICETTNAGCLFTLASTLQLFDFELTTDDMASVKALNKHKRLVASYLINKDG